MDDAARIATTLHLVGMVAMAVQFLIFVYLYATHRFRFFGYLVWGWGLFLSWKIWHLARMFLPELRPVDVALNAAGLSGELMVVAAALAFRRGYRLRASHAILGGAMAIFVCAMRGWSRSMYTMTPESLLSGALLITAGIVFGAPRLRPRPAAGARVLGVSLVLWGAHRIAAGYVETGPGSAGMIAVNVTFVLFYFLTVFGIIILVLERARAETASLKEFNERLVHGLGEGLQLIDGDFVVRHANRWMEQGLGPTAGRRCYEIVNAERRPCTGCPLATREAMAEPTRVEVLGPGDRRLLLTCSPVRQPDGETLLLELVADVTEQERLRARLADAEQLAAAGELAAAVAHEIRNPLAGIVNATALLEEPDALTPDERRATVGAVKKEARRLNGILSDFLRFAGPREPKRVEADVREVMEHVAALLRDDGATAAGLRVEVSVAAGVPRFTFDPDHLTQVLWNIALNGVEAMRDAGRRGGCLRIEAERQRDEVCIAVTDEGPGIAPEDQRRIFQPFYSRRRGGTGLGLAIAKRMVAAHGGRLELTSAAGTGSRFTIRLPIRER